MKRKLLIGVLAGAVVLGGAVAVGANDSDNISAKNKKEMITIEEAETIALKEVSGTVEDVELEREHLKLVYKVDIDENQVANDDDKEVHVDANTGEILKVEKDDDNDDDDFKSSKAKTNQKEISQDEAIKIAEKAVNGKVHSIEKEYDDGRIKYEFELSSDKGEVDVEIDALTGDILEMDYDD